jgi:pimeloyl-ACP methyl ester carboxylesterase
MTTFVLVHPAWHGGWCWKKVALRLRRSGHEVLTPTLSGLGDRSHVATPAIGLDTHITDVVNLLIYEDLAEVVLVGHSSSGAVVTGVADRVPERIGQMVYLDAFVPGHGESVLDLLAPERRQVLQRMVEREGEGWRLPRFAPPPWETIVREMWGVTDDVDVRSLLERLTPTPFRHFTDPVRRSSATADALPRTYIRCRRFPSARFDQHAAIARRSPLWSLRELDTSHHPAVTSPDALASLLGDIAAQARRHEPAERSIGH